MSAGKSDPRVGLSDFKQVGRFLRYPVSRELKDKQEGGSQAACHNPKEQQMVEEHHDRPLNEHQSGLIQFLRGLNRDMEQIRAAGVNHDARAALLKRKKQSWQSSLWCLCNDPDMLLQWLLGARPLELTNVFHTTNEWMDLSNYPASSNSVPKYLRPVARLLQAHTGIRLSVKDISTDSRLRQQHLQDGVPTLITVPLVLLYVVVSDEQKTDVEVVSLIECLVYAIQLASVSEDTNLSLSNLETSVALGLSIVEIWEIVTHRLYETYFTGCKRPSTQRVHAADSEFDANSDLDTSFEG